MDIDELKLTVRQTLDDLEEPYLWSDAELESFINEAHAEAATRTKSIVDEDNPVYCSIPIVPGTSGYTLHPYVLGVKSVYLDDVLVPRTTVEELNDLTPTWKTDTSLTVKYYVTSSGIRLVPTPTEAGTLALIVSRLPVPIVSVPEIHTRYHIKMLDWVYRLAYLKRDADVIEVNPERPAGLAASLYEAKFDKSFGPSTDATIQHNEVNYRVTVVNHWVI